MFARRPFCWWVREIWAHMGHSLWESVNFRGSRGLGLRVWKWINQTKYVHTRQTMPKIYERWGQNGSNWLIIKFFVGKISGNIFYKFRTLAKFSQSKNVKILSNLIIYGEIFTFVNYFYSFQIQVLNFSVKFREFFPMQLSKISEDFIKLRIFHIRKKLTS